MDVSAHMQYVTSRRSERKMHGYRINTLHVVVCMHYQFFIRCMNWIYIFYFILCREVGLDERIVN